MSSSPVPITNKPAQSSRPSSRSSLRSHSPSYSFDDPVHVRNQISSLKHTIRHQQAQLHSLENIIRAGPRPYSSDLSMSMSSDDTATLVASPSAPPSAYAVPTSKKAKRRSSYDVLQGIAGPESNLPLPKRVDDANDDVIREGIPMSFGSPPAILAARRPSSPTRSLSRIPVSAVGNARALADDGHTNHNFTTPTRQSIGITKSPPPSPNTLNLAFNSSSASLNPPSPSPRRLSSTPGGTTKVLADLQAGVINARNALENTKSQLRLSQRTVASLTRKVEDLKEVEERLRIENEGLNNVVARKERLLQEVLERARKAEAEATTLKQSLKQETSTSKKTIREMESQLSESTALSKKSEREYITLRDSVKGLVESWKHDTESLRGDMKKREERWKKEVDGVGKKYRDLVQNVKEREKVWEEEFKRVREEDRQLGKEVEGVWEKRVKEMEGQVERSQKSCKKAESTAQELAIELAILRKRMKSVRAPTINGDMSANDQQQQSTSTSNASDTSPQEENVPP
ncbi:hypothetical protein P691DRAFT_692489 [Macrolepiota fuliginosa MF-IS2]|uniref:SWI5-dependent HO expression protein 3 n=1 Tax=Macrolepiota fuliginosa MF-IS2 TaxID=1400762 RepID=A0A9P6CAQ0_9AGAR|nr:hypothetical protein P691DRAFT_692489 [Macrolepiota fuliginosa MF-IS2]